jgi:gliding motility-associated-like protein
MIGILHKKVYFSPLNLNKRLQKQRNMYKILKKSLLALMFSIPLLLSSYQAEATHVMGADITYRCIDTLKFEITVKYYRWCGGVGFSNPSSATKIRCASGGSANVSLTLDNIKEITPVCATATGECVPSNTYGTGQGIEQHTYKATIDFNSSPYSSLASSCCKIIIETGQCCRNSNINTGASNANFYTYAELDICKAPCNSSPALTSEPIAILCCNQPFFFNNGASDTSDFDSLSYSWAQPKSAYSTNIGYSGTWYAYNHPFKAYYPGSLQPPYKNPNASPPIGITLDPESGDIILTPTRCDEVTVAVIEVKEWRKDSTGTYQNIGATRRDMQFITKTCPDNNPPIINGPYSYNVCAGSQLCFNITTNDPVFTPPPPATAPAPDTVKVSWNRGIPGATFSVINPTARLQTGQFCWTPGVDQASDLPYAFTVTARDNACPLNAVTVRSFRITVKHKAEAERDVDTLPCGKYAFKSTPIQGFRGTPSYRWQILDSNLNIVFDNKLAKFNSTGNFLSIKQEDTIQFRRGGKYIIQHTINNAPQNCPTTYYDTLIVPQLLEANLSLGKDTFICAGTTLRIDPYLRNAVNTPLKYQWSTMGVTDLGLFVNNAVTKAKDTLTYFDLAVPSVTYDTAVSIMITDAIGCSTQDTVRIFLKANPKAVLPSDPRLCTYDSILIIPNLDTAYWVDHENGDTLLQGDTLFKEWFYEGSTIPFSLEDSVTIHKRGQYVLRVYDSLRCSDTDTLYLFVNDTVKANAGLDRTLCFNDTIFLNAQGLDTSGTGKSGWYKWHNITPVPKQVVTPNNGQNTQYKILAKDNVEYSLDLFVTEGGVQCFDDDSVYISVNQLPVISIRGNKDICCDYGNISLNFDIISPAGGAWSCKTNPYWVNSNTFFTDSACGTVAKKVFVHYTYQDPQTLCINSDSLSITVNPLPTLNLREKDYCQDVGQVKMKDALVISPATYLGTPSWKCLDCNGNDFSKMLIDKGQGGLTEYWLDVSKGKYTIQNPDKDTIKLEFTYVNEKGCRSTDTVDVRIWRVPIITFSRLRDLCWDEGKISLNNLTGVNLTDGVWTVYDSIGAFRPGTQLGGFKGDTINTLSSTPLANSAATPNKWIIRYTHTATGCPAFNDTTLRINPLPTLTLTDFDRQPPNYCESTADITLIANPSGGTWTSSNPPALVGGNKFSPGNATAIGSPIWFKYSYTNPTTGCKNADSIDAQVDPLPELNLPADTVYCRPLGSMNSSLPFTVTAANNSSLAWFPANVYGNASRASLSPTPNLTVGLTHQNVKADTFRIIVAAGGQGSCNDIDDFFDIIVNPRPDAFITPSNLNGCNPVTSDFAVTFNNTIDPATTLYNWDLGNTSTSTVSAPSATYTADGTSNISLVITSDKGCDTTITSSIDVYPIPVASFVPNPNNYTTAALPRFFFNNSSSVTNVLNSTITDNLWDFGDPNNTEDTSMRRDPSWFYNSDTATYQVKLTVVTNHGCRDSMYYPVVVGPDLIVYIPNAFTPDKAGPQDNEGFRAIISGEKTMRLIIFNRWGEIMFETTDKEIKWDGMYKGAPAQQDVYAYTLEAVSLNDEVYTYSGTITLIR